MPAESFTLGVTGTALVIALTLGRVLKVRVAVTGMQRILRAVYAEEGRTLQCKVKF